MNADHQTAAHKEFAATKTVTDPYKHGGAQKPPAQVASNGWHDQTHASLAQSPNPNNNLSLSV